MRLQQVYTVAEVDHAITLRTSHMYKASSLDIAFYFLQVQTRINKNQTMKNNFSFFFSMIFNRKQSAPAIVGLLIWKLLSPHYFWQLTRTMGCFVTKEGGGGQRDQGPRPIEESEGSRETCRKVDSEPSFPLCLFLIALLYIYIYV